MKLPCDDINRDAAGFVLAGGESRRMGTDKALVDFGGQMLVARAVAILEGAGLAVAIAGARSELHIYAPVIPDTEPGLGPLTGICAALKSTSAQHSVFISVDSPLLPAGLILYLLWHARITHRAVTLASVNGIPQTFPVVLDASVLPALEVELRAGRRGCFSAFRAAAAQREESMSILPVETLVQCGQVFHPEFLPPSCWFLNINSEVELRHALPYLRDQNRVS